jgi:ATP-dependent RNA helicase HelY
VVSALVYEARRDAEDRMAVPQGGVATAVAGMLRLWSELETAEQQRGLRLTREPDLGFVWPVFRWARGEPLAKVLASAQGMDGEMPAGDFVRWTRQVVDLLDQISVAAGEDEQLRSTARRAMDAINRGVVAYTSVT